MRHSPCFSLLLLLIPAVGAGQAREGFLERPHGIQLYYRVEGHGSDTLIYLHGGPGGTLSDGPIEENQPLFQRHTVIFYQQRGTGRSSPGTEEASRGAVASRRSTPPTTLSRSHGSSRSIRCRRGEPIFRLPPLSSPVLTLRSNGYSTMRPTGMLSLPTARPVALSCA